MNNDDTEEETETSGDLRFIVSSTRKDNKGKL